MARFNNNDPIILKLCSRKRKNLERDVKSLKLSIESAPITRGNFVLGMDEVDEYLKTKDVEWNLEGLKPILVGNLSCAWLIVNINEID